MGAVFALSVCVPASSAATPNPEIVAFFENQVRPLLAKNCFECHGPKLQKASLRLDSRTAILAGGDSGPALVPGQPAKSLILDAVNHKGEIRMPPKKKLSKSEITTLTRWIDLGAPWPGKEANVTVRTGGIMEQDRQFWSFRPVKKSPPPSVRNQAWILSPIDRFILAQLEKRGLKPASQADRLMLIRRATFDLIGLPPTPEEVDAFLADQSADAFARVFDRLLASPHYGERWGRHWLDVVRYADTAGETADYPVSQSYRYRNYVIDSFNHDKPYDEFLREQVAGDILAKTGPKEKYAERIIATGYLAISRRFGFDPQNYHHLTIADTIDTLGQSVLGLSLGCARCHDHKYDPVYRPDYYSLYGIFASTRYAFPGSEEKKRPHDLIPLSLGVDGKSPKSADNQELAYAVAEGKSQNARIHKRGEPRDLGAEVPRRFLVILGGDRLPTSENGSGRLQLAHWLTRTTNPLTARVMVNRIWQHHFGVGLVSTENDFGTRGRRPSHPELLDYLAHEFMSHGWSIKWLHRQIMLSRTYRQSSAWQESNAKIDPDNRYLWRYNRRRLDAEAIRDSLLAVSGKLDRSKGGPHPFPPVDKWGFTQHNPFIAVYATNRRSVYLMTQRIKRHPFLALFDGADANASTARRLATTVPTQILFFLNDPFVHEQATSLADHVTGNSTQEKDRIRLAFRLALSRQASDEESASTAQFLQSYRQQLKALNTPVGQIERLSWSAFARTLFARNEFLFVE